MHIAPADRKLLASLAALVTLGIGLQAAQAQFTAPTCTPPNCSPAVIQNIPLTGTTQSAGINISGDVKLGATFQVGANSPVLSVATDNLMYGNVGGTSVDGSLILLQFGALDRLRVSLIGQLQLPLGTAALPSYTFLGDTNTGIYHGAADTINFVTGGVSRESIDATGAVAVPGDMTVGGIFTASGGYSGDGSSLINLNAANITSGTLNDARLSSNIALLNGTQTFTGADTFSNAGNSFTGTHTGTGAGLTALNGTNIASGTVADARLSANIPLKNAANALTGNNTLSGMTSFGSAALAVTGAQNLLYGNIDATSTGNLLLLQNESVDMFKVDAGGALTVGIVPWARLSGIPGSPCAANQYVNDVSTGGCGTPTLMEADTLQSVAGRGNTTTTTVAVGGAAADAARGVNAQGTAFGIYGAATDAGSTGAYGQGQGTGVWGYGLASGSTGVYGVGGASGYGVTGNAGYIGVYGDGASYGGYFTGAAVGVYAFGTTAVEANGSLTVSGNSSLGDATTDRTTLNGELRLGLLSADPAGTNGLMVYNTTAAKFHCYEGDAWKDCISTGLGGSGTVDTIPKFTAASTLGNSLITDDGSTITTGGDAIVSGTMRVNGAANLGGVGLNALSTGGGSVGTRSEGGSYGVFGIITGSTAGSIGVRGTSAGGYGLYGDGDFGVYGSGATYGGYFVGNGGAGIAVNAAGSLVVSGNSTLGDATADQTSVLGKFVLGGIGSDPTGANGMIYYNTTGIGKFRCYENGAWKDCIATLQGAYDNGSTIETTTNPVALQETSAGPLANSVLSVTGNPSSGAYTGSLVTVTMNAAVDNAFSGQGIRVVVYPPKVSSGASAGAALLVEDDAGADKFYVQKTGYIFGNAGQFLQSSAFQGNIALDIDHTGASTLGQGVRISASNAAGVITDAINVSDAEIVNAVNVGANKIAGTSALIDFTNFDVDSAGAITAAGATINGPATINGNTTSNGNISFSADGQGITFAAADATNNPMIQMFASGSTNGDRMVIAHSPAFTNYGLQYSDSGDEFRFLGAGTNMLAIDVVSPNPVLTVNGQANPAATFNRTNDGAVINLASAGVIQGTISIAGTTTSYNAFTGSHYAWTDQDIERGMLVSMTGQNRHYHDDPNAEVVYGVVKTAQADDQAVLGSYLSILEPNKPYGADNPRLVMAVGNGELWVVENSVGSIRPGDELISSETVGHAMKDPGTYDKSYVVARAAEIVDWSKVNDKIGGKKRKKISVIFVSYSRKN